MAGSPKKGLPEILLGHVVDAPGGCLLWMARRNTDGYAQLHGEAPLHRRVWAEANGPIPDGMVVRHRCDVRHCVRLSHLELGTHVDNMRDMVKRGRSLFGEKNKSAKLTEAQVMEIRRLRKGGLFVADIARLFRVSRSTVGDIVNGVKWKHLPWPDTTHEVTP